jgi:hypothetical protein
VLFNLLELKAQGSGAGITRPSPIFCSGPGRGCTQAQKEPSPGARARSACVEQTKIIWSLHPTAPTPFDSSLRFPGEGPPHGKCNIYFANITSWSDKAIDDLLHKRGSPPHEAEVVCVAEHHLMVSKLKGPRKLIGKAGRFPFITSATPPVQGGSSGGRWSSPAKD